jgi:hypothetical protein
MILPMLSVESVKYREKNLKIACVNIFLIFFIFFLDFNFYIVYNVIIKKDDSNKIGFLKS